MIKEKILVAKVPVKIRKSPSIQSESVGTLAIGDKIKVIKDNGSWIEHDKGWSVKKYFDDDVISKLDREPLMLKSNVNLDTRIGDVKRNINDQVQNVLTADGTIDAVKDIVLGTKSVTTIDTKTGLRGLFGMPFAYTDLADPIPGTGRRSYGASDESGNKWFFGRVYSETFLADLPLLVLTAGVPSFMTQASEKDKQIVFSELAGGGDVDGNLGKYMTDQMEAGGLEYFTFKESMLEYFGYVNFMCRSIASFLNLSNSSFMDQIKSSFIQGFFDNGGADITGTNWMYYAATDEIDQFAGKSYTPYVAFYVDPGSGSSESISNSTTQSILAGINQFADKSRDMGFLFSHITSKDMAMYSEKVNDSLTKDFAEMTMNGRSSSRFDSMITSSAAVLKNGGKMIFPDIWSDSTYNKSYSIDVKLHSPYGDKMSIFLHVLVPFVFLFCMAAPRQLGINGIMSPFLVRAFVKGDFSCSMGIVDSFSFKKAGGGDGWSIDNLPTSIEVTMSITELYSALSISRVENLGDTLGIAGMNYPLSNTMLIDFMANLTASDMNMNQFTRKIQIVSIFLRSKVSDFAGTIGFKVVRGVRETVFRTLKGLGLQ